MDLQEVLELQDPLDRVMDPLAQPEILVCEGPLVVPLVQPELQGLQEHKDQLGLVTQDPWDRPGRRVLLEPQGCTVCLAPQEAQELLDLPGLQGLLDLQV